MAPKNSRKSPIVMTEKVLAECHEIYSDKENGLIEIAKSLGSYGSRGLYHPSLKIMISQKSKCHHDVKFPIFYSLIQSQSRFILLFPSLISNLKWSGFLTENVKIWSCWHQEKK